jgi:hypothetical protein
MSVVGVGKTKARYPPAVVFPHVGVVMVVQLSVIRAANVPTGQSAQLASATAVAGIWARKVAFEAFVFEAFVFEVFGFEVFVVVVFVVEAFVVEAFVVSAFVLVSEAFVVPHTGVLTVAQSSVTRAANVRPTVQSMPHTESCVALPATV